MANIWSAAHYNNKADRREYALAVMAATIEACAKECEQTCLPDCGCMQDCASAIRALAKDGET